MGIESDTPGTIGIRNEYLIYYDANGNRRAIKGNKQSINAPNAKMIGIKPIEDFSGNLDDAMVYTGEGETEYRAYAGENEFVENGTALPRGQMAVSGERLYYGIQGDSENGRDKAIEGEFDFIKQGAGNLAVDGRTDDVKLNWGGQAINVHLTGEYKIYRQSEYETVYSEIGSTAARNFEDTDVTDGITYNYYVKLELTTSYGQQKTDQTQTKSIDYQGGGGGGGGGSDPPGSSPTNVYLSSGSRVGSVIEATWSTNGVNPVIARLERDEGGGNWGVWDTVSLGAGASRTDFGGTDQPTGYTYRAKARFENDDGVGPWSDYSNEYFNSSTK